MSVDQGDRADEVLDYARRKGATFVPVLNKTPDDVVEKYKVEGFPTNVVIDREGKVTARIVGYDMAKLRAALRKSGVLE